MRKQIEHAVPRLTSCFRGSCRCIHEEPTQCVKRPSEHAHCVPSGSWHTRGSTRLAAVETWRAFRTNSGASGRKMACLQCCITTTSKARLPHRRRKLSTLSEGPFQRSQQNTTNTPSKQRRLRMWRAGRASKKTKLERWCKL